MPPRRPPAAAPIDGGAPGVFTNLSLHPPGNFSSKCPCLTLLTPCEREVMAPVLAGHAGKVIERQLGISHRTVDIRRANVMHKAGTGNLLDIANVAGDCGIAVDPALPPPQETG
jgi:DNA-binding NarL/FixJ family response regulator